MNNKSNKMFPKEIGPLHFIERIHALEGIIFELKEVLKYYSDKKVYEGFAAGYNWSSSIENDKGNKARKVLEKYNKTWDQIYDEVDNDLNKYLENKE